MNHREAIKLIDSAFNRLSRCCESKREWDRFVEIEREEANEHRKFKPASLECGLTKWEEVRLFAVQHVFERFVPNGSESIFTPQAKDFFHIKRSVFAACAIADMCSEQILKEFSDPEMVEWLKSIDYAELNKDPRMVAA